MLVVMQSHATSGQVDRVMETIVAMGLTPHASPAPTRTATSITANTSEVDSRPLEVLPGVMELIRVTKPYKLASREMHREDTIIRLPLPRRGEGQPPLFSAPIGGEDRGEGTVGPAIGPGTFTIIGGPCSVENEAMIQKT